MPAHLTPFRAKLSRLRPDSTRSCDVAVVGAGAAGLATAIFTRRLNAGCSILLLEGARRPGAKILVSGGSRCNVTNAVVSDTDFWGGRRTIIRRVLRGLPVPDTIAFFREIGVGLHEEADGKLFPDSQRARDVLQALLDETHRTGATLTSDTRVLDVERDGEGFRVATSRGDIRAARVVLATGGQSLPKSGSDGAAFEIARRLGHTIVPTTPALVPLLLAGGAESIHGTLSGVAQPVELALRTDGTVSARLTGSLLWTHFGISGPVTLNMSRHWLRARLENRPSSLTANMCPGQTFEDGETPRNAYNGALDDPPHIGRDSRPRSAANRRADNARTFHTRRSTAPDSCADRVAARRNGLTRLHIRGSHCRRCVPERNRRVDHAVTTVPGTVSGRRNPRCGRPDRRLQLSVGVVERAGGRLYAERRVRKY